MSRVPPSPRDLEHRRRLLAVAVSILGGQDEAAEAIGVTQPTISHWIAGKREVEWHVVHAAISRAIALSPAEAPRLVEAFARRVLDASGTWVPDIEPDGERTLTEESADVTVAQAKVLELAHKGERAAREEAASNLVRQAVECAVVARRGVA